MSAHSRAARLAVYLFASGLSSLGQRQRVHCGRRKGRPREGADVPGLSRPRRPIKDPRRAEHRRPDRALPRWHSFRRSNPGARKNDAMSVVAPSLSDKDIEDLAAYFSAIEIKVVKIPGE